MIKVLIMLLQQFEGLSDDLAYARCRISELETIISSGKAENARLIRRIDDLINPKSTLQCPGEKQ